jgi:hypothetical protein
VDKLSDVVSLLSHKISGESVARLFPVIYHVVYLLLQITLVTQIWTSGTILWWLQHTALLFSIYASSFSGLVTSLSKLGGIAPSNGISDIALPLA